MDGAMDEVASTDSHDSSVRRGLIEQQVLNLLGRRPRTVYEAGGGSKSILDQHLLAEAQTTVVDLSAEQIAKCSYATVAIHGNIETWKREDYFDLVCCTNVLEHVRDARSALENFAASLAPGGICVVGGPVPTSVKGWITRLTPHAVHVWYYRRVGGSTTAGLPGYAPFPTFFSPGSHHHDMSRVLAAAGVPTKKLFVYENNQSRNLKEKNKALNLVYSAVCGSLAAMSLGRYQPRLTDFVLIAQKSPAMAAGR